MKYSYLLIISLIAFNTAFAQSPKMPVVEHFTNTLCAVCGYKNPPMYEVLNQYPNVLHIAYHPSSPYAGCIFSQHNVEDNNERTNYYGVYGSTPRVLLNGIELPPQNPMVTEEDLNMAIEESSNYNISLTQSETGASQMNVKVSIQKTSDDAATNLDLYIGLAENEINYNAPNGENVHHQVFRLKLAQESIASMEVDELIEYNYTYSFHGDWQSDEMFAYAILQDDSKLVLQSGKSPLVGDLTGIGDQLIDNDLINIGPNPADGTLFISHSSNIKFNAIQVFNLYGQMVLNQSFSDVLNIETLESGVYILQMQTILGEKAQMKFQKL